MLANFKPMQFSETLNIMIHLSSNSFVYVDSTAWVVYITVDVRWVEFFSVSMQGSEHVCFHRMSDLIGHLSKVNKMLPFTLSYYDL